MSRTPKRQRTASVETDPLLALRNVGPAIRRNFHILGIETPEQLAARTADDLYRRLGAALGERVDPCVHDVFSAAIHEARTGEARVWWAFSEARKDRQKAGDFPTLSGAT